MPRSRVLAIGLDGYELTLAERLMADGLLPRMSALRARSVRFALSHGREKYSGLTWEHFSSGRTPENGGRWSAISFDPVSYHVRQDETSLRPFAADVDAHTVIFDVPYFDLAQAPDVRGITNWGAHDPGTSECARPGELIEEIRARFGRYPAKDYIYPFVWPSAEGTRLAADRLERAVDVRADAARWLLAERCPGWDLGIVVVSETHSATEPMWHGIDASHPLYGVTSAPHARDGLIKVYQAVDRLIGTLVDALPDATVLLFAMHGMGPNKSDVPAMLLLGELMFRHAFGAPYLQEVAWPEQTGRGVPLLPERMHWSEAMKQIVPWLSPWPTKEWEAAIARLSASVDFPAQGWPTVHQESGIDWMPVARYRPFWPLMDAFALPAFYDGRVRINLHGREAHGIVRRENYETVRSDIERCIAQCKDILTGESVVEEFYRTDADPYALDGAGSDIYVVWHGSPSGFVHPTLGTIGPVPFFRVGGHTGGDGFLYAAGPGFSSGDRGRGNSFDVVPTIIDMLGLSPPKHLNGRSLL